MLRFGGRHSWLWVLWAAALLLSPVAGAWGQTPATASAPAPTNAWDDVVALVERGEVPAESADAVVEAPIRRMADWLGERSRLESSRTALTRSDFDEYVARARKWHNRGKIARALEYAFAAFTNTTDKDALRQEPWLGELRRDAVAKAEEHRGRNEWLDAHAIYYELSKIFEHDKDLRTQRNECLTHARIEAIYKPDTKWEESLEGIDPAMVKEALWRIDQKYVKEADFRALTEAGLKHILLLTESPSLRKLFEFLRDDTRRQEFQDRLQARLGQVREAGSIARNEATHYFDRLLTINRQTVQLPEALLAAEFMDGSLATLDEFTSVIWPVDYKEFQKHTRGNFIGVGIQIRQKYDEETECNQIVVVTPLEDTPAYRAGVQADDIIEKVDGKSLCEMDISLTKAVEMITGPEGTSVTLTLRRSSENREMELKLARERVEIYSVKGTARSTTDEQKWNHLLDPELGIGYARVTNFQENTVDELRKIIAALQKSNNLRGFVLDLRFNPGGLLTSAVEMAEMFLGKSDLIVRTAGLRSRPFEIPAQRDGPFRDLPLIVLVNGYSASASEIVAGAIKDHHRGLIVGERTFGKFSVQNLIQLVRSDAHLKLTTANYYLPSGRCLHREEDSTEWGVEPDITVALVPKELRKVLDIRRNADVLGPRGRINDQEDEESEGLPKKPSTRPNGTTRPHHTDPASRPVDSESPSSQTKPARENATGSGDAATQPGDDAEEEDPPDANNRPDVDPQLETALLLLRVRLMAEDFPIIAQQGKTAATAEPAALAEDKATTK